MPKIPTKLEAGTANNVLAYSEHIFMKEGNLKDKSVAEVLNEYNDIDKPRTDEKINSIKNNYQKKLTAGTGITITDEGTISATGDSVSVISADGVNYTQLNGIKSNAKEQFDRLFYSIVSNNSLTKDNLIDINYDLNNLENNKIYTTIIPSTITNLLNKPVPTTGMSGKLITIGNNVSRTSGDLQLMLYDSYREYSIHIREYYDNEWKEWIEINPTINSKYKDKNITYESSKIFGYKGYIKPTSSNYKLSGYFNIKDNVSIIGSFSSEIGFSRVVFYDNDFNYIGEITNDTVGSTKDIILKFGDNCPIDAKYARASLISSGYITYKDDYSYNHDYKIYDIIYKLANNINNNISDINDINNIVYYLKNTYMNIEKCEILSPINEFINYAQYLTKADYMRPLDGFNIHEYDISNRPINYISINAYQGEPSNKSVVYLDNNRSIIEGISLPKGHNNNYIIRVPNNATYVRLQSLNISKCAFVKYIDKSISKNINIRASYISDIGYYINPNQIIGNTVSILEMSGNKYYIYDIPINTSIKATINNVGMYGYCLVKKEDNTVLEYYSSQNYSEIITNKYNFETQFYASATKLLSIYLLKENTLFNIVEDLYNNNNNNNYWRNKKIWWCGTSIPAGTGSLLGNGDVQGSYPKEVGVILNCTVHNVAVGGSMCRANVRTGNYAGLNYDNITSALTRTKEENEYFINNYDTIKNIPQNASFPDSINSSYLNRLRTASFEDKILPLLANDNIDLFVIDHGHNDFKYKMPDDTTSDINLMPTVNNINDGILAEDIFMTNNNYERLAYFLGFYKEDDNTKGDGDALKNRLTNYNFDDFVASLNRNCFIGSVNFLMTVILSRKPNARFMFVSNYEYKYGRYTSYSPVIDAQHYLSDSWAFPICDVYKYLGFSNHIIPHSKEYLEKIFRNESKPNYIQNIINNNKDTIAFNIYNCDEVHPHTDISGISTKIYAGILSEFIKTCR